MRKACAVSPAALGLPSELRSRRIVLVTSLCLPLPTFHRPDLSAPEAKASDKPSHDALIPNFGYSSIAFSHGSRSYAGHQFPIAQLNQVAWYLSSAARNPRSKRLFSASSLPTTASFGSTMWRLMAGRSSATAAAKRKKTATILRHFTMLPLVQVWS